MKSLKLKAMLSTAGMLLGLVLVVSCFGFILYTLPVEFVFYVFCGSIVAYWIYAVYLINLHRLESEERLKNLLASYETKVDK